MFLWNSYQLYRFTVIPVISKCSYLRVGFQVGDLPAFALLLARIVNDLDLAILALKSLYCWSGEGRPHALPTSVTVLLAPRMDPHLLHSDQLLSEFSFPSESSSSVSQPNKISKTKQINPSFNSASPQSLLPVFLICCLAMSETSLKLTIFFQAGYSFGNSNN